jgi:hypothetical protein
MFESKEDHACITEVEDVPIRSPEELLTLLGSSTPPPAKLCLTLAIRPKRYPITPTSQLTNKIK